MIYKLKSLEYAKEHFLLDRLEGKSIDSGGFWPSEEEKDKSKNDSKAYVKYISTYSFGKIVTNDKKFKGVTTPHHFNDADFKYVFDWAADFEITKEDHPEYFL